MDKAFKVMIIFFFIRLFIHPWDQLFSESPEDEIQMIPDTANTTQKDISPEIINFNLHRINPENTLTFYLLDKRLFSKRKNPVFLNFNKIAGFHNSFKKRGLKLFPTQKEENWGLNTQYRTYSPTVGHFPVFIKNENYIF